MSRFAVVVDACVLYSAPLRDTLLRLALADLFRLHWTDRIHDEWSRHLVASGRITQAKAGRLRRLMDTHARDANVTGYEPLIESIELPDPDDRHVVAAAIRCHADAIVTFNLADFPTPVLARHQLDVIHPDDFLCYQIDLAPGRCVAALRAQRQALRHPPYSAEQFLDTLLRQQLPQTVERLREFSQLL